MAISSQPPPFDITTVFPELSALTATAVRLHPRAGRPDARDSSLGGPLLWPAGEPWSFCTEPHVHSEQIQVPADVAMSGQASMWAFEHGFLGIQRQGSGPVYAVGRLVTRPPVVPSPLVGVLQI